MEYAPLAAAVLKQALADVRDRRLDPRWLTGPTARFWCDVGGVRHEAFLRASKRAR